MLDRLEAAFVGQRQFLDDAGHELKTPLTVLRGHLELLDDGDPEEVAETRELLLDEVDRMSRLVGDLILLAKSDRPDFVALGRSTSTGLTDDVLAKARAWATGPGRSTRPRSVTVPLDEQRVTQALLQLADNAVKHTAPATRSRSGRRTTAGGAAVGARHRARRAGRGPGADLRAFRPQRRAGTTGLRSGPLDRPRDRRAHGGTSPSRTSSRAAPGS